MAGPFISFLTDFGAAATAPAVCRGIILGIAPEARIVDLTHAVRPYAIRDGAFLLWSAVPYLPIGIHLAVVDPGVGTSRRGIALRAARGDLLVGPDNGLLVPAAERLGGVAEARVLSNPALWRDEVSSTFHGRDVFSPVAARLAAGQPLESVGERLAADQLVELRLPDARIQEGRLESAVIMVDTYGNCRLAGELRDLEAAVGRVDPGRRLRVTLEGGAGLAQLEVPFQRTFGHVEPGEALLYEDADYAGLALAVNQASAADRFGLRPDEPVRIEPA